MILKSPILSRLCGGVMMAVVVPLLPVAGALLLTAKAVSGTKWGHGHGAMAGGMLILAAAIPAILATIVAFITAPFLGAMCIPAGIAACSVLGFVAGVCVTPEE